MNPPIVLRGLFGLPDTPISTLAWEPFREGIEIHRIYGGGADGPAAALLRYAAGAGVATHLHQGYEHVLVLSGSQIDDAGEHHAGTLIINQPGSVHTVHSPGGCTVLIVWEKPVAFVAI